MGGRQVLDVGHLDQRPRLGAAVTQTACGARVRGDAAGHDRVLVPVLVAVQELLAEVRVDGRVGAAARRSGKRQRARAQALTADQQLRTGADEGGVAAADGVDERRRERPAQQPEQPPGSNGWGACTSTSRASTIFTNSPARIRSTARATASS